MEIILFLKLKVYKFNLITHVTTACNYDCSYCDVVKDWRKISQEDKKRILWFIENNSEYIWRFKFFWWEPLIGFKDIKYIIDSTHTVIWKNYEIVTNTTLLNDEIWEYLAKYFSHIFFSIDCENNFNYENVLHYINKYDLEKKLYFNLVISPGEEWVALEQYQKLYDLGMRGFNILPVYFTQSWTPNNLKDLSRVMKHILDASLNDASLRLYWFQENIWYDISLANNTIFIDVDGKVYYSDMASTFSWKKIRKDLLLWDISTFMLTEYLGSTFDKQKKSITLLEEKLYSLVSGQRELHKLMDYFSHYLNKRNG